MNNILTRMDEDMRKLTIQEIDSFTGADINDMPAICKYQKDLVLKRDILLRSLYNDDNGPTKLSEVLEKAKRKTTEIEQVQENYSVFLDKVQDFFKKWDPLKSELEKRYKVIDKFNGTIVYLKSYEEINELSTKLKNTNDEQEAVQIYGEIKTLAVKHKLGHRAVYIKEILHYWHNILKENFSIQYEEVLKTIKWPITSEAENYSPPKDAMIKFNNLTKNLFLIQEPKETGADILDQEPSLPIKLLLQPLKKRFAFHFMGNRETARVDRPEWFLTQTLTWIREHSEFIQKNVQPIADKLQLDVQVENEFNSGLILLASERLHTILGLLLNPSNVGVDRDAAFAHAVDETLGFHNELVTLTGMKSNSVLSVLTKAENLLRWLAVERKYALAKIEESLNSPNWMEPVVDSKGVSSGVWVGPRGVEGPELWVPRAADWFISLLRTVEHRYAMLPQPGHRSFIEEGYRLYNITLLSIGVEQQDEMLQKLENYFLRASVACGSSENTPLSETHMTPLSALSLLVEADLTFEQYQILRRKVKWMYPSFNEIRELRKECYPQKEGYTITKDLAAVNLQNLLDHTTTRLLVHLDTSILNLSEEECSSLKFIYKWGYDMLKKEQLERMAPDNMANDADLFISCITPVQLVCGVENTKVLWKNPIRNSIRFTRPIRIRFVQDSADIHKEEIFYIENALDSLQNTQYVMTNKSYTVKHVLNHISLDIHMDNICYICREKSENFNELAFKKETYNEDSNYAIYVSQVGIQLFETLLQLAYRLPIKKWKPESDNDEAIVEKQRTKIQEAFKQETGLTIDVPLTGFGDDKDFYPSSKFFVDPEMAAKITDLDFDLIYQTAVILEVMASGREIDLMKFNEYGIEVAKLYTRLYPWCPMAPIMHKIYTHGKIVMENELLPFDLLCEEAAATRIKFWEANLKFSFEACNLHIINRLMLRSDPKISGMMPKLHRDFDEVSDDALNLLILAESESSEEYTDTDESVSEM